MEFFSFWDGKPLTIYEELCLRSFEEHGFKIRLYSYNPNIAGNQIRVHPADTILDEFTFSSFGHFASFSNHFRYCALNGAESGSTWVDLDVLCLRPDWPKQTFLAGFETRKRVNNAVLRIPRDTQLLQYLIQNSAIDDSSVYGATGPFLLTSGLDKYGKNFKLQPIKSFYPMGHWELDLLFDPEKLELAEAQFRNSYGLHLYNQLLVRAAIPKNVLPPAGSFLHQKFMTLMPQLKSSVTLGDEWLLGWSRNFHERRLLNRLGRHLGPLKSPLKRSLRLGI